MSAYNGSSGSSLIMRASLPILHKRDHYWQLSMDTTTATAKTSTCINNDTINTCSVHNALNTYMFSLMHLWHGPEPITDHLISWGVLNVHGPGKFGFFSLPQH